MLAAVLISFVAWVFVVYNFEPDIKTVYTDVPVQFIGEDTLANKGYGVVSSDIDAITVTLQQKRVDTPNITSESITVTADVSEAEEGENTIALSVMSPNGTTVLESDIHSISVKTEEIERKDVSVYVEYADTEGEDNAEPVATNLTSETVTVIGAASMLGDVDRAVAYINAEDVANGPRTFTRRLVAVDSKGEAMPHMVLYPDRINFSAYAAVTKEVPVEIIAVDNSDDSYTRTCTGPDTITVKGAWEIIDDIDSIQTTEIDLSRIYEDTEIEIEYDLPEGAFLSNADSAETDIVRVKVTQKEETDQT